MTTKDEASVTQADREAANEWVRGMPLGLKLTLHEPHKLYEAFARHRTASTAALVDRNPSVGASTPEPSLREIVFEYYSAHFDEARSADLTTRYFAALSQEQGR